VIVCLALLAALGEPPAEAAPGPEPLSLEAKEFDPAAWDRILLAHVDQGILDYAAVGPDEVAAVDGWLAAAGEFKLTTVFGKEPRAAFLVNAYNAWAARQILSHPDATSLTDIPGFFDKNKIAVAGEKRTLNDIEDLLATVFPEHPLILFSLSPGGAGYPLLPMRAYTGKTLVETNQDCFLEYIHRPGFGKDEATGAVTLPRCLERHRAWFDATERGMLGVIGAELEVGTVIALSDPATKVLYPEPDPAIPGRAPAGAGTASGSKDGAGW